MVEASFFLPADLQPFRRTRFLYSTSIFENSYTRSTKTSFCALFITQYPPQDFPTRAFGNRVNNLNSTFQPLVPRLIFFNMLLNTPYKEPFAFFYCSRDFDYESFGRFSSSIVWYLNNGTIANSRVTKNAGF